MYKRQLLWRILFVINAYFVIGSHTVYYTHLIRHVLRMKIGETIRISDREGGTYFCKIAETGENFVQADIVSVDEEGTELPSKIYLFQALPKGDRMETVIEKAVELGVYEIIPVAMKYLSLIHI